MSARARPSVIVVGPQGCGKTRNATRIARALGLRRIYDVDFIAGVDRFDPSDTLYLTCEDIPKRLRSHAMPFVEAMRRVRAQEAA